MTCFEFGEVHRGSSGDVFFAIVVSVASDVCPFLGEVGPGACTRLLMGGTGACSLVAGAVSCLSGGQGLSRSVLRELWSQDNFRQPLC